MKTRIVPESNYKSIFLSSGKTIRMAIDPSKPVTELKYPEFYDIKLTNYCPKEASCQFCYQKSSHTEAHYENIVEKFRKLMDNTPEDHRFFQQAAGGGEIVFHPEFHEYCKVSMEEYNVVPNYTTNGVWALTMEDSDINKVIETTKKYCGGVAVSAHPHLEKYWRKAIEFYIENGIRTNFHHIISDKESIDRFLNIFEEYKDKVDYFVLLPFKAVGRAKGMNEELDWEYFVEKFPKDKNDTAKIAFGANFYEYLLKGELDVPVSLYVPHILSKFLDMKDGNVYPSSFETDKPLYNIFETNPN